VQVITRGFPSTIKNEQKGASNGFAARHLIVFSRNYTSRKR
jgi:hypothetical protein